MMKPYVTAEEYRLLWAFLLCDARAIKQNKIKLNKLGKILLVASREQTFHHSSIKKS